MAIFLNKAKNYIINGALDHWQRGTSFAAIATGAYSADRFFYSKNGTMVHTVTKDTDVPTIDEAGAIVPASYRLNLTTAQTTIAAGNLLTVSQRIEGQVFMALAGKTMTLSFWVKATTPGVYPVAFRNGAFNRSLVKTYTINVANKWEKKSLTLTHDTSGTWDYTTGTGLEVDFTLACGSTFQTGITDVWQDGNYLGTPGSINGVNTGATDFRIALIQLEEGASVSGFQRFAYNPLMELGVCFRYYEQCTVATSGTAASTFSRYSAVYRTRKRVPPNLAFTIIAGQNSAVPSSSFTTVDGAYGHSNGAAVNDWTAWTLAADAEL